MSPLTGLESTPCMDFTSGPTGMSGGCIPSSAKDSIIGLSSSRKESIVTHKALDMFPNWAKITSVKHKYGQSSSRKEGISAGLSAGIPGSWTLISEPIEGGNLTFLW